MFGKCPSTLILDWLTTELQFGSYFPQKFEGIVLPALNVAVEKSKAIVILDPLYETCFLSGSFYSFLFIPRVVQLCLMAYVGVGLLLIHSARHSVGSFNVELMSCSTGENF